MAPLEVRRFEWPQLQVLDACVCISLSIQAHLMLSTHPSRDVLGSYVSHCRTATTADLVMHAFCDDDQMHSRGAPVEPADGRRVPLGCCSLSEIGSVHEI